MRVMMLTVVHNDEPPCALERQRGGAGAGVTQLQVLKTRLTSVFSVANSTIFLGTFSELTENMICRVK